MNLLPEAHEHLQSVHVEGFRGIEGLKLNGLEHFNVLIGGNNSGKTSFLEAIAVLLSGPSVDGWYRVARERELRSVGHNPDHLTILETISWMFPLQNFGEFSDGAPIFSNIEISAESRSGSQRLSASAEEIFGIIPPEDLKKSFRYRRQEAEEPAEDTGLHISIDYNNSATAFKPGIHFTDDEVIWSSIGIRSLSSRAFSRPHQNFGYLSPYGHRNSSDGQRALARVRGFRTLELINDLLKDLDDRIEAIEIAPTQYQSRGRLTVRMRDGSAIPLALMGDGTRRALSIATSFLNARNGVLLIDELEAGFHVKVLGRVYQWIIRSAERFNTQVIATTHSIEALTEIAKAVSEDPDLDGSMAAYSFPDSHVGGAAKKYSLRMLQRVVLDGGLDIRL